MLTFHISAKARELAKVYPDVLAAICASTEDILVAVSARAAADHFLDRFFMAFCESPGVDLAALTDVLYKHRDVLNNAIREAGVLTAWCREEARAGRPIQDKYIIPEAAEYVVGVPRNPIFLSIIHTGSSTQVFRDILHYRAVLYRLTEVLSILNRNGYAGRLATHGKYKYVTTMRLRALVEAGGGKAVAKWLYDQGNRRAYLQELMNVP